MGRLDEAECGRATTNHGELRDQKLGSITLAKEMEMDEKTNNISR